MDAGITEMTPIQEAFKAAGYRSQAELARRLKASESQVSRWLRGENVPHERLWQRRIARALNSTPGELWP